MAKITRAAAVATSPADAAPVPDADNESGAQALAEAEQQEAGEAVTETADPAEKFEAFDEESAPVVDEVATVQVEFKGVPPYFRHFHSARSISEGDLARIGIEHKGGLHFTPENGWLQSVPADNERLLTYFRETDAGFVVID